MTAREAALRYGAIDERAAAGFATAQLHHWRGHDPRPTLRSPTGPQSSWAGAPMNWEVMGATSRAALVSS